MKGTCKWNNSPEVNLVCQEDKKLEPHDWELVFVLWLLRLAEWKISKEKTACVRELCDLRQRPVFSCIVHTVSVFSIKCLKKNIPKYSGIQISESVILKVCFKSLEKKVRWTISQTFIPQYYTSSYFSSISILKYNYIWKCDMLGNMLNV